ncbi:hypothetical protein QBC47DRAFT_405496 [Echria macrotheca]|uniref:Meiotic recombination protein dmc1 n=1 Tax=Echria macrotheca TaxID=438768 RepID=A0AAJ0F3I7_9PEZI|nr:hypothetical protein QBC47DRAFT_405496 [Echria macrotheca]
MADGTQTSTTGAGGFLVPLPSPAPSNDFVRPSSLPHPRGHALRPGSAKEDKVRNYVANRIGHINRRFFKKSGLAAMAPPTDDGVTGYKSMGEMCKDLDELINIIWLSGTPSLQIPYLLNIASELNTWLPSFPPSPKATFLVLSKLDHCFASLVAGMDVNTEEPLPGFENGMRAGMSRTDMVRCKSTAQQTRVVIMDVMSEEPGQEEESENDADADEDGDSDDDGPTDWGKVVAKQKRRDKREDEERHMDMARVYEKTLVQLGKTLQDGDLAGGIQISDD